jgi:hypothetical protein
VPASDKVNLKLIPIDQLVPHEETVPHLADRLSRRMMRDSVQRDPIIVDGRSLIVLDGMHRLASLKRMGARSVVCSLVDYMSDDVKLLRWFRFVERPDEGLVLEMRRELAMTEETPFSWDDGALYSGLILTYRGKAFKRATEATTESVIETTRKFDRVARDDDAPMGFIDEGTVSTELLTGDYMALITPSFKKEQVVRAAMEGRLFPPKTTLHVLPARPMGVNYPISLLRAQEDILERMLATRTPRTIEAPSFYRGRLYREPVVVFE